MAEMRWAVTEQRGRSDSRQKAAAAALGEPETVIDSPAPSPEACLVPLFTRSFSLHGTRSQLLRRGHCAVVVPPVCILRVQSRTSCVSSCEA